MPDKVIVLFIGDVIGRPGRRALKQHMSALVRKYNPSLVIANAENAAGGIGLTEKIAEELFESVDVLTSGNHIWDKKEALELLGKEPRLLRPANYPLQNPGHGAYVFTDDQGRKIGVLNLQGRVFMEPLDCPFLVADRELEALRKITPVIFVDFHAEATSEKQAMGWYLDGRVSAVVGTHTHVPTADERILPGGTGYITDIGMVGGYNSVIGIKRDQAVMRFLSSRPQRFEPSKEGMIFSFFCAEIDARTGKALRIQRESLIESNEGNK
jgi:metallophosphoesterase (TIGR00282 family)